jgi:hypothetical protein
VRRRPLSGALKAHLLSAHLLFPCDEPACNSAIVEQRGRIFRNAERLNRFFSFHFLWIDLNDRRTLHLRKQRLGGVGYFKHWLERRDAPITQTRAFDRRFPHGALQKAPRQGRGGSD